MANEDTLHVSGTSVSRDAVVDATLRTGRDVRYLVAALATLLSAVLLPTFAVAAGVPFQTVFPVGALLFLATPIGLALWLRSSVTALVVETPDETYRERVDDNRAWAEAVVTELGDERQ